MDGSQRGFHGMREGFWTLLTCSSSGRSMVPAKISNLNDPECPQWFGWFWEEQNQQDRLLKYTIFVQLNQSALQ